MTKRYVESYMQDATESIMTATTNFVMEEALAYAQPLQVDLVLEQAMMSWPWLKYLRS